MKRILIVEDDKFLRDLVIAKLKISNYEVRGAIDGEEGLQKAKEKPDLILLDLVLPGINGFDVLKKIKEDPNLAQIPVVILSNLGQKEDVERCMQLGAADFLVKAEFTTEDILDKIKAILDQNK